MVIVVAGCPGPQSWNSCYIRFSVFPLKDRAACLVDALTTFPTDKWEPVRPRVFRGSQYQLGRYHGYGVEGASGRFSRYALSQNS
jgi:hypothetical protein